MFRSKSGVKCRTDECEAMTGATDTSHARNIAAFEALDALLLEVSIDQRDLDLAIRAKVPFEE